MKNIEEINDFSEGITEATASVVKNVANKLSQSGSSILSSDNIQPREQNILESSSQEVSTMISMVTEKAETLATTAIRKLVKATLPISTPVSSHRLSDTSLANGQPSSYSSNTFSVTDIPVSGLPTASSFEVEGMSEIVINNASEDELTTHLPFVEMGNENSS